MEEELLVQTLEMKIKAPWAGVKVEITSSCLFEDGVIGGESPFLPARNEFVWSQTVSWFVLSDILPSPVWSSQVNGMRANGGLEKVTERRKYEGNEGRSGRMCEQKKGGMAGSCFWGIWEGGVKHSETLPHPHAPLYCCHVFILSLLDL